MRKGKELAEIRLHRIETTVHTQGTELLRIKKEREIMTKRLHDAERQSGAATRSAANMDKVKMIFGNKFDFNSIGYFREPLQKNLIN